jgi:hypothetical protein
MNTNFLNRLSCKEISAKPNVNAVACRQAAPFPIKPLMRLSAECRYAGFAGLAK